MQVSSIVCDACGTSIESKDSSARVWTKIGLYPVFGVAGRCYEEFDLCPACQDAITSSIRNIQSFNKAKFG